MNPRTDPSAIRLGPSLVVRWWRSLMAWAGDHPWTLGLGIVAVAGAVLFYGVRLNGFVHLSDALNRWRIEAFGGTFRVERAIEVPDVILSLRGENFDRVDAVSGSTGFLGGTAFRREIAAIASREGAKIRVVTHDPRMADPAHPQHAAFNALAAALGYKPWEYAARCRHSAAVLLHLLEDFAPVMEVKLLDTPLAGVAPPFFSGGRSVQLYRAEDPSVRLDILVPAPSEADGMDSFSHPALIIRNRPGDSEVRRFQAAFADAWSRAKPFDAAARAEITGLLGVGVP